MVLEDQEDGALDADLLGVGGGEAVEGVLGVGAEGAESPRQVCLAVLQASEVGGEACEVAPGGTVVALSLVSSGRASPFVRRGPRTSCGSEAFMAWVLR